MSISDESPGKKNILLIGKGGREHALAWAIRNSPATDQLYVAPGNPGIGLVGNNVQLDISNFEQIAEFIEANGIDLTVIGPEQPLVDGIADYLEERGHPVFGPSAAAAQLEGSKGFAKNIMQKYGIPTASYVIFGKDEFGKAEAYIDSYEHFPIVIKADGLAGGKGVFICHGKDEANRYLKTLRDDPQFSEAGQTLVFEEFMKGEEASVFVISDGENIHFLADAQDHKPVGEGDTGLNTGGMGAFSPATVMTDTLRDEVMNKIARPVISAMKKEGIPYKGVLYCGLMITGEGPKVVEFNCRFGDPECQAMMPRLKTDIVQLMLLTASGKLDQLKVELDDGYCCCVILASDGYPGSYEKGKVIEGLNKIEEPALAFHSGTAEEGAHIVTSGGRVLGIVGSGKTLHEAIDEAYRQVGKIHFDKMYFRRDIGKKGLKYI